MFFIPAPFTIKPHYKKRSLCFRTCDATVAPVGNMYGYKFPYDTTKNVWGESFVPDTFKAGTGALIVIYGAVDVANETGLEKQVVITSKLYRGRDGVAGSQIITADKTIITIPVGEPVDTVHRINLGTLAGLQAGDVFSWNVARSTIDEDDTWDFFYWLSIKMVLKYIADKIGVDV